MTERPSIETFRPWEILSYRPFDNLCNIYRLLNTPILNCKQSIDMSFWMVYTLECVRGVFTHAATITKNPYHV
jgi:hypothetical protein